MSDKILIVDDVATNRIVMKVKLASACYGTLQAATGAEALAMARRERPTLIVLDYKLPDGTGLDVLAALRADPATRAIPVVMVSAVAGSGLRLAALAAGADDVFAKPVPEALLLARIRSLLRRAARREELRRDMAEALAEEPASYAPPARISLIGPAGPSRVLRQSLIGRLRDAVVMNDRAQALAQEDSSDVQMILCESAAPEQALRLVSEFRARPGARDTALCVLTPGGDSACAVMALDLGADDAVPAETSPDELALRLRALIAAKRATDTLRRHVSDGLRAARTDPLTGLSNRRGALPYLEQTVASARSLALLMLDLDHFKRVNDEFGHAGGDAVLRQVAERLSLALRPQDLAVRYGGEEFLVALPDVTLAEAQALAERLHGVIGAQPMRLPVAPFSLTISASVGLAHAPMPLREPVDSLLHSADLALLDAKRAGRNRVCCAQPARAA